MALSKIIAEGVDLTDTFAFTGTVTGAGLTSPFANTVAVTSEGGAVTTNLAQGLAKAWSNFNGVGTIALRDSSNVASLSDDGVGAYTVNLTNALSNANYCVTGIGNDEGGQQNHNFFRFDATPTTSACPLTTGTGHHSGVTAGLHLDVSNVHTVIMGDLA